MKRLTLLLILTILLTLLFSSCGPSAEEITAMTAAAASPTPAPPTATPVPTATFTPTPLPFDLTLNIVDQDGEAIPGAVGLLSSLDYADSERVSDDNGMLTWANLPEDKAFFSINASGYFPLESSAEVLPGPNEVTITLERDPFGLLPSDACVQGEIPISIEDMQDNTLQDWSNITNKLASGAPGLELIEDPDQPGNILLRASNTVEGHVQLGAFDDSVGNAVLRFKTRNNSSQHLHVGWHSTEQSRYIAFIYADQVGGRIDKFMGNTDNNGFTVMNIGGYIGDGNWHTIEISSFEDVLELWIDGVQRASWQDKQPLLDGNTFIDIDFWKPDLYAEFDDFTFCELNAPFTSLYAEE